MTEKCGGRRRAIRRIAPVVVAMATVGGVTVGLGEPAAAVGNPRGSACGYYTDVSMFQSNNILRGCGQGKMPTDAYSKRVVLPAGGSASQISYYDGNGARAQYLLGYLFSGPWTDPNASVPPMSGVISVNTKGVSTVISEANVASVGPQQFTASNVYAKCTLQADGTSIAYTTTITNGVVVTSTDVDGETLTSETVPANPSPGYHVAGSLSSTPSGNETFDIYFNERVNNGDGTYTLSAVHMVLHGPDAVGHMYIGQVMCGM